MSLTANLRGGLQFFEKLIENKHMDTNELCDKSTGNADNGDALRTLSGQDSPGIRFQSRDEAIERLCQKVLGASPVYPTPPAECPTPQTDAWRKRDMHTLERAFQFMEELEHQLAKAIEQRDALAEALEEMRYAHTDKAERMAVAALAAVQLNASAELKRVLDSADVEFPLS